MARREEHFVRQIVCTAIEEFGQLPRDLRTTERSAWLFKGQANRSSHKKLCAHPSVWRMAIAAGRRVSRPTGFGSWIKSGNLTTFTVYKQTTHKQNTKAFKPVKFSFFCRHTNNKDFSFLLYAAEFCSNVLCTHISVRLPDPPCCWTERWQPVCVCVQEEPGQPEVMSEHAAVQCARAIASLWILGNFWTLQTRPRLGGSLFIKSGG